MTKWEYAMTAWSIGAPDQERNKTPKRWGWWTDFTEKTKPHFLTGDLRDLLRFMGTNGWELASAKNIDVYSGFLVFKRPLAPESADLPRIGDNPAVSLAGV